MWKWGTTVGLRAVSAFYLLSASAFGFALALQAGQPWALGTKRVAEATGPFLAATARQANENGIQPAWAFTQKTARVAEIRLQAQIALWMAKPAAPQPVRVAPVAVAKVIPKASPLAKTVAPPPKMELAQPALRTAEAETPELLPAPDTAPPSAGEVGRVLSHLKVSLTRELYDNFSLFLYVSKADHGPWQQRMFVFAKETSGDLKLRYSFPVSTGKEVLTPGPKGNLLRTNTPPGIYQLDPERMYKRYTSGEWQHKMPYAMFFNWEHDGLQTGLAIHAAVGADVGDLGRRASAGCVRLAPDRKSVV